MQNETSALIELAWDAVLERRDRGSGAAVRRPDTEPLPERRLESRFDPELPVLACLDSALDLVQRHELAQLGAAMRAMADRLHWSQNPKYDLANVSQEFLDGYAYAGLAGPDCPLQCEVPRCGFLLLGPGVTYIDHQHAPREIYLIMTPGAQWRLDSGEWFDVDAGELILHAPWQMHAMRTAERPLLAFASWLDRGHRDEIRI